MTVPKINSAHGSDTRNILNRAIDSINVHGKSIQDLVAEGQLTPTQYAELIQSVNALVSKGNVTFDDIDINQGKMLPKHLSEEVLSMITGDAPINAVPADGSITTEKIAKKAIDPSKTNFIKAPNNLINKFNLISNKTIDLSTGLVIESNVDDITDFIPALPQTVYTRKNTSRFFLYDENKNFINGNSSQTVTTGLSTRYMRFSIPKSNVDSAQVNLGETLLEYDEYIYQVGEENVMPITINFVENSIDGDSIKDNSVGFNKVSFVKKSTNLFDKDTIILNKGVDTTTGEVIDFPGAFTTPLIPFTPGVYSKKDLNRWVFYRSDGSFSVSSISDTYEFPQTTGFIRVTGTIGDQETAQINEGDSILDYERYGHILDASLLPETLSGPNRNWLNDRIIHLEGKVDGTYKSIQLESKEPGIVDSLVGYTVNDYYADYDALLAKYPDYITKTLLGYDASGTFPIYRYDFVPPRPPNHGYYSDITLPKAVLVSGSHPERMGIWCLFKTMESIAERWKEDEHLATLRNNLHFIVVPLWAPWNVENSERWNSNLVNVGRNFPELFVKLPVEDSKYGGTEPLSEPESQYLHKILTEEEDILFHIDFHNFFSTNAFVWVDTKSAAMGIVAEQHIYKMTGEWKNRYSEIPQDDNHYVGYVTFKGDPNGHNCTFAESIGIRSVTYEVSERLNFEEGQERYTSRGITLGVEAFTNYLISILKYTVNEKDGS